VTDKPTGLFHLTIVLDMAVNYFPTCSHALSPEVYPSPCTDGVTSGCRMRPLHIPTLASATCAWSSTKFCSYKQFCLLLHNDWPELTELQQFRQSTDQAPVL